MVRSEEGGGGGGEGRWICVFSVVRSSVREAAVLYGRRAGEEGRAAIPLFLSIAALLRDLVRARVRARVHAHASRRGPREK